MRRILVASLMLLLSGCFSTRGADPLFAADAEDVQPGEPKGMTFAVNGSVGYDRIWAAAMSAMSNGMTVIESHKPSGTIKSRVGSGPSGKVVGMFITPTAPMAIEYRIETSSVKPLGFNSIDGRGWEPSVIADFKKALHLH